MNRYMVAMAMAILMTGSDSLAGQTSARIEYRDGRIGLGVAIGRLPMGVTPAGVRAGGWIAADWGPLRIHVASHPSFPAHGTMERWDLRYLLGKETVKRIERHAKRLGIRGRTQGQWFRVDGRTTVLEVTVARIPVAELYDYRSDGIIDELYLVGPPRAAGFGSWGQGAGAYIFEPQGERRKRVAVPRRRPR